MLLFVLIFPSLSTEHKELFWDHSICLIDSPSRDEDTLQLRVTCLPHSAITLGLTSSVTSSVDKDINIALRLNKKQKLLVGSFSIIISTITLWYLTSFEYFFLQCSSEFVCNTFVTDFPLKIKSLN